MIYILGLFFVLSIIFIIRNRQKSASVFLLIMLLSLIAVSASFTIYMAKDNSYYYLIHNYFNIGTNAWAELMFFPIDKDTIIRFLNISSLLFVYSSLCFPIAFTSLIDPPLQKKLMWTLAVIPFLQIILFDPGVQVALYYKVYPDYISAAAFKAVQRGIFITTKVINGIYLLGGVTVFVLTYIKSSHIRLIRSYTLLILVSHFFLVGYYGIVLWWAPSYLITISKIASYKAYLSMPLYRTAGLYQIFPYFALVVLGLIAFILYEHSLMQKKMQSKKLEISRNIDAANVTSSVFCHYMKNELRAMMAQIELKEYEPEDTDHGGLLDTIMERCTHIYNRLDDIHRGTKMSKLNLKPVAVSEPIQEVIEKVKRGSVPAAIRLDKPKSDAYALLDSEYFKMVIENLVGNAAEARKRDAAAVNIMIRIETHNPWIIVSVSDDGVGIAPNKLDMIFNPFYSSKPTSTNWGVGLSMCHKIITAHEGKLEAESVEGEGTTIKILLPLIFTA